MSIITSEGDMTEDQGKGIQDSGKTGICVRGIGMGSEEGTGKKLEVAEIRMLGWMCRFTR